MSNINNPTSFYTEEELSDLGLKSYGKNVRISRFARIYSPGNISIGDNVRIDDFCILSAGKSITIGNYVHIACYTSIIGSGEVIISDYCGISGRVSVYSSTDDYSGEYMTNPMVPDIYTNVTSKPIIFEKHVIVGAGTIILPGVTLHEGVAIGALSLVQHSCRANRIYSGNPIKPLCERSTHYKDIEKQFENK